MSARTGGCNCGAVRLEIRGEPTTSNFTHFDTFIKQDGDTVRMTRLPEEIVFDPMPNRETASFGAMPETTMAEGGITDETETNQGVPA